ncbi:MAG: NMD protein affecting ribosome stability and mRNA decay [Methanosphaera sp.]|nr:NMD protein affecting ribosome stability and mRNA decay [Methanosphaera sp.]
MFCLLCNADEELYDGLCRDCYLKEFTPATIDQHATFTVCSHCGASLKHDKWVQSGYYDDEIINDAITEKLEVSDKLEDVEVYTEITNNRNTVYDCVLHINGVLLGESVEYTYPVEVKVEKSVCPDCSKFYSGYYEAVIQLRADKRKLDEDEINSADEFISNEIQRLCKTNKLAYVTKRVVLKEGIDYQVGSYNVAHKICVNMQKQFGGIITESRKIVGHDKSKSRDLYRSWISLRLPSCKHDDFIEYDNKVLKVTKIGSHKLVGLNLETHKEESIPWKEYESIDKVATQDDVKSTIITNITPDIIQILDPDTYMPIDYEWIDSMSKYSIGQDINVIKIKEKIYILI